MPAEKSKRGRKKKEEYYKTKQADTVNFEKENVIIHLPINIDIIKRDYSREEQIMLENPQCISGYQKENFYSEALVDDVEKDLKEIKEILEIKEKRDPDYEEFVPGEISNTYNLDLIPEIFDTNDDYNTGIACWWCCHSFDCAPIFMPVSMHNYENKYRVKGVFCSFECCYAYMMDNSKYKCNKPILTSMFKEMTKKKGGLDDNIKKAPKRECLKLFGGPLSIDEFRNNKCYISFNKCPQTYIKDQVVIKKPTTKDQELKQILPSSNRKTNIKLPKNNLSKVIGIAIKR